MNDPIRQAFETALQEGRIGLVCFLTVGYPSLEVSVDCALAALRAGADVLELGVPFSDPLAEGPTIQKSSGVALKNGVNVRTCIDAARRIRSTGATAPLILMGYYNPILAYGVDRFVQDAAAAGVDGLIVPDLPTEESGQLRKAATKSGLSVVPLLAVTSPEHRIADACKVAAGFVYCVSTLGVTGARAQLSTRVRGLVEVVRRHTDLPVAVGFGVSTPQHVHEIAEFADGAVVGSALIQAVEHGPLDSAAERVQQFVQSLRSGTERPEIPAH